jgi:glutaredoxin
MITLYTLENCPHCEQLKERLTAAGYEFQEKNMQDGEALAEMRINGCFEVMAPVLLVDGRFYSAAMCENEAFLTMTFGELPPVNAPPMPDFEETRTTLQEKAVEPRVEEVQKEPLVYQFEVISGRCAPDLYAVLEAHMEETHRLKIDTTLKSGQAILDVIRDGHRFTLEMRYK